MVTILLQTERRKDWSDVFCLGEMKGVAASGNKPSFKVLVYGFRKSGGKVKKFEVRV